MTIHDQKKIIFLVWDKQSIRASGISRQLGATIHYLFTSRVKHPVLYVKTLRILSKQKPDVIFCQSPPITCAFVAFIYKYILAPFPGPKILIDVHTGAITRPWFKNFSRLIMKHATLNIVINEEQQSHLVESYNIKPVILEDPIPDFSQILFSTEIKRSYALQQNAVYNVAVVCSYAYDEPLREIFEAASDLTDFCFYITGDKNNADKGLLDRKPANVIITDFLKYDTYIDLLNKVDVIMDLTTERTSIVAGAYEAVSLQKPLITSNWPPLRRYFNKGTIFTNNTTKEIKNAVLSAVAKKEELSEEMQQLKKQRTKDWLDKVSKLSLVLS